MLKHGFLAGSAVFPCWDRNASPVCAREHWALWVEQCWQPVQHHKVKHRFQSPRPRELNTAILEFLVFSYPWIDSWHWLAAAPLCWFRMLMLSTALCGNLMFSAAEVMVPTINMLRSFTSQRSLIFSLLFLPSSSEATRVKPADKFLRPVCIRSLKAEPRLCFPVNSMCTWHWRRLKQPDELTCGDELGQPFLPVPFPRLFMETEDFLIEEIICVLCVCSWIPEWVWMWQRRNRHTVRTRSLKMEITSEQNYIISITLT